MYKLYLLEVDKEPFLEENDYHTFLNKVGKLYYFKTGRWLFSELNEMQGKAQYAYSTLENKVFNNKYTIPVYFVNLILQKAQMQIK